MRLCGKIEKPDGGFRVTTLQLRFTAIIILTTHQKIEEKKKGGRWPAASGRLPVKDGREEVWKVGIFRRIFQLSPILQNAGRTPTYTPKAFAAARSGFCIRPYPAFQWFLLFSERLLVMVLIIFILIFDYF